MGVGYLDFSFFVYFSIDVDAFSASLVLCFPFAVSTLSCHGFTWCHGLLLPPCRLLLSSMGRVGGGDGWRSRLELDDWHGWRDDLDSSNDNTQQQQLAIMTAQELCGHGRCNPPTLLFKVQMSFFGNGKDSCNMGLLYS